MVVGLYLILTGERPRAGLLVTVIAAIYFVAIKLILMPHFLNGYPAYINQYEGLLPEGETGFGGVHQDGDRQPGLHGRQPARARQAGLSLQMVTPAGVLRLAAADRPALLDPRVHLHDAGDALPAAHLAVVPVHRLLDRLPVHRRGGEPRLAPPPGGSRRRLGPPAAAQAWLVASPPARSSPRTSSASSSSTTPPGGASRRSTSASTTPTGPATPTSTAHQADPPGGQRGGRRDHRVRRSPAARTPTPPHRPSTTPTTSWPASPAAARTGPTSSMRCSRALRAGGTKRASSCSSGGGAGRHGRGVPAGSRFRRQCRCVEARVPVSYSSL